MEIHPRDRVLVDTTPYGLPGAHWCEVVDAIHGVATTTVQLRVRIPTTSSPTLGNYQRDELMDHHPATTRG
jgi:hypothetical protein